MRSYKEISGRYLKSNKKRTILTVIGIILSVALITSILTFVMTVQKTMLERNIKEYGKYHVSIENISPGDIDKLKANVNVENIGLEGKEDPVTFVKEKQISLLHLNDDAFDLIGVVIEDGELPKNSSEVAIEKWVLKYFDDVVNVGDTVTIPDSDGNNKEYKLTGIVESNWESQYEGVAKGYTYESNIGTESNNVEAFIKLKDGSDKNEIVSDIYKEFPTNEVKSNENLLRLEGESSNEVINSSLITLVIFVVSIVVVATVVVIYNAFHISLTDRIKQFGLLRAIGTTKKQIMNLVLREATIMILIGVPLGIISGIAAVYVICFVFGKISTSGEFSSLKVYIAPVAILSSALIGIVSTYVSAYLPAMAAGRISPLVAINSNSLIKKERRVHKGILGRILKVDLSMAVKNSRRNRKQFIIAVLSMAISVTLFVTFMTFAGETTNFMDDISESSDIAFDLNFYNVKEEENLNVDKVIDDVKAVEGVSAVYKDYSSINITCFVDSDKIPQAVREWQSKEEERGVSVNIDDVDIENSKMAGLPINIQTYDTDKLSKSSKYVKEGSIENLSKGEVIVVRNTIFFGEKSLISPIADLKAGDEIYLKDGFNENENNGNENNKDRNSKIEKSSLKKVKVAAIVDTQPFFAGEYAEALTVIGAPETTKELVPSDFLNGLSVCGLSIDIADDKYEDSVDQELMRIEGTTPGATYTNILKSSREEKQFNLQLMILLMGFIIVITLIGCVNIINTVTTSVLLRKREIAMLEAIGMTRKQVRRMITFEGMLFGIYGGIIGAAVGTFLSYKLYQVITNMRDFAYIIPWKYIIISVAAVIILGYISALVPLKKIRKESIIDGIREN